MARYIVFPAEPGSEEEVSLRQAERMYLEDRWAFTVRSGKLVWISIPAKEKTADPGDGQ